MLEDYREKVILAGGFNCYLTAAEMNEYHAYFFTLPECQERIKQRAERDSLKCVAKGTGSDASLSRLMEMEIAEERLGRQLFDIAAAWYAGLVERRKQHESEDSSKPE